MPSNQAQMQRRSKRWLFWSYLLLALPTLFVVVVVRPTGDTNPLMWWSSIAAIMLSLPWYLFNTATAEPLGMIAFSIALNAVILWALTRSRRPKPARESHES